MISLPVMQQQQQQHPVRLESAVSSSNDVVFASYKVDHNSPTPYSDATQVGPVTLKFTFNFF